MLRSEVGEGHWNLRRTLREVGRDLRTQRPNIFSKHSGGILEY